jgi:predicted Zn finger-like uncharacterized protein
MSLATRCTACGTVFRVVQDQLKVSEGWVRCGRCEEVFNALEGLFDLEREAPPPWPPTPVDEPASQREEEEWRLSQLPYAAPTRRPGKAPPPPPEEEDFADARFPSDILGDSDMSLEEVDAGAEADEFVPEAVEPAPRFVRQAQREEQWRRPGVRAALSAAALLLGLVLLGQAMLHFRDGLAAHWPDSRPALDAMCRQFGCRIEPLRRVDNIMVDSSGLTKLGDAGLYRISIVLRNRGGTEVMLPAIDLTLTDSLGQLVSRKVVTAVELGAPQRTLGAGAELSLQGVLASGERRIAGYQVEIFYP